jgi:hypothetical protein
MLQNQSRFQPTFLERNATPQLMPTNREQTLLVNEMPKYQ